MFQRFFKDGVENKFIKSLVYNTNLPSIDYIVDGDYVIGGCTYLYETTVVECVKSGIFDHYFVDTVSTDAEKAVCKYRSDYIIESRYDTYTRNRLSRNSYYDSETHRWLGDYLRFYRATKGIDLMPYYNCFNYTVFDGFILDKTVSGGIRYLEKASSNAKGSRKYKVFAVPIKLNKTYTIAADCLSGAAIRPVYYSGYSFCNVILKDDNSEIDRSYSLTNMATNCLEIYTPNITDIYNVPMQFNIPIKLRINTSLLYNSQRNRISAISKEKQEKLLKDFERYLYLIIQLPTDAETSIAVLEWDALPYRANQIYSKEYLSSYTDLEMDRLMQSRLSLLTVNDKNIYAYNNRLIEYLLGNVVDMNDIYSKDIKIAQEYLGYEATKITSIWSNKMRSDIYDRYKRYNKNSVDFRGYLDKDAEKALMNKRMNK